MQIEALPIPSSSRRQEVMERLFTDLQVARLNQLYYRARAKRLKRAIMLANVIAALSASAAFTQLLRNSGNSLPLQILVLIAAVSAAIVPVLSLEDKYSALEKAALGHTIAYDRIWSLLRDLKLNEIDDAHEAREREINAVRDALSALDEDPHNALRRTCWEEVERELPADKAWTIV